MRFASANPVASLRMSSARCPVPASSARSGAFYLFVGKESCHPERSRWFATASEGHPCLEVNGRILPKARFGHNDKRKCHTLASQDAMAAPASGEGIPHEKVLAEFGLNSQDFKRMGRTPLKIA